MDNLELLKLMTDSANDAVTISKEEFDIDLDYSVNSIASVDELLNNFLSKYQDTALEDKAVFTLCNMYGAYVGETFRKHTGGNWVFDETQAEAPFIFVVIGENSYAFAGMCYERLVQRSDKSVSDYFNAASAQHPLKH